MSGDAHVRICESLGVKFPRATRLFVRISGETHYLWRAVDHEGEVLAWIFHEAGRLPYFGSAGIFLEG